MTSIDFMDKDEPNFYWKNLNAVIDMECIIESELPEISPNQRYETITNIGRSGELHETFGDYEAYDYPIKNITIPYHRLAEVKRWLTGYGRLITHNDSDKYRECICQTGKETEFENEWGVFYTFSVTFRSQPFRRKVREVAKPFSKGTFNFFDPGDEVAKPLIEVDATGGNFTLQIGNRTLTIVNALSGKVLIDCEFGKILQGTATLYSKGEWLKIAPGENKLITSGNLTGGTLLNRSVWL
ncbi:phage tail protein [Jeotgalibaca arthritidis]|uniref:phage tail protein n=1 Tax=Jeotgalibaca arthritidis TaxID=1868794 RepID=UPI0035A0C3C7